MNQIVKLNEHLINQIAAGEVIENPSSVVKELLDNSIDAGAKRIHLKIKQGGKEYISVEDDGFGMTKENLELSIERHATSKICTKEDLFSLKTMGFRGEALASIASISKMEIVSSRDAAAHKLVINGGKIESLLPFKRALGTTIIVQSLFYNVPVRKKFQKSTSYCTREIIHSVQMQALAHPEVYISLETEEKTFNYMPTSSRKNRVADVLGKHFVKDSFTISLDEGPFQIEGIISSPLQYKTHRKSQYFFINNRPVTCPYLSCAVREGYGTFLREKTFPLFAFFLTLPEQDVDVNVHPQKKEVRLLDERSLFKKIETAVFEALSKDQFAHDIQTESLVDTDKERDLDGPLYSLRGIFEYQEKIPVTSNGESFSEDVIDLSHKSVLEDPLKKAGFENFGDHQGRDSASYEKTELEVCVSGKPALIRSEENIYDNFSTRVDVQSKSFTLSKPYQLDLSDKNLYEKQAEYAFQKQQSSFSFEKEKDFAICYKKGHLMLMQESEIFLIGNNENRLVLIDLQAAYAKILFQTKEKEQAIYGQRLCLSKTLELSQDEITLIVEHEALLKNLGMEFRIMGDHTIALDSFLSFISYEKIEEFFKNLIKELFSKGKIKQDSGGVLKARLCSQIARRRRMFSDEEAKKMLRILIKNGEYTFDPLGKKILTFINQEQLEKFLKI